MNREEQEIAKNISKEEAKKRADEIIQNRLKEIAGENDEIVTKNGHTTMGSGKGKHIEAPIDKESASMLRDSGSLGLSSFSTLGEVSDEGTESSPERNKHDNMDNEETKVASQAELEAMIKKSEKEEELEPKEKENKVAYADREEDPIVDMTKTFEERMDEVGLSRDEAIDLILQLTDNGYIEEVISIFGGKVVCIVRSPKMIDSANFIDLLDEEQMNTPAKVEFYLNLYSMAAVLMKYNNNNLSDMDIKERSQWIEENIPTVIYKAILPKVQKFHLKIELLSSDEVADFFS